MSGSRSWAAAFLTARYSERQVHEIVLAIAVKTLSNYAHHLFGIPVDAVFTKQGWTDPRRET